MNNCVFRDLTIKEKRLLDWLLEKPFPGRDEIRKQIRYAKVKVSNEHVKHYLRMEFQVHTKILAPVISKIPVKTNIYDEDGDIIEINLYVRNGIIDELETIKCSGKPFIYLKV